MLLNKANLISWVTWSNGTCPCKWQVLSNPNHSMILIAFATKHTGVLILPGELGHSWGCWVWGTCEAHSLVKPRLCYMEAHTHPSFPLSWWVGEQLPSLGMGSVSELSCRGWGSSQACASSSLWSPPSTLCSCVPEKAPRWDFASLTCLRHGDGRSLLTQRRAIPHNSSVSHIVLCCSM